MSMVLGSTVSEIATAATAAMGVGIPLLLNAFGDSVLNTPGGAPAGRSTRDVTGGIALEIVKGVAYGFGSSLQSKYDLSSGSVDDVSNEIRNTNARKIADDIKVSKMDPHTLKTNATNIQGVADELDVVDDIDLGEPPPKSHETTDGASITQTAMDGLINLLRPELARLQKNPSEFILHELLNRAGFNGKVESLGPILEKFIMSNLKHPSGHTDWARQQAQQHEEIKQLIKDYTGRAMKAVSDKYDSLAEVCCNCIPNNTTSSNTTANATPGNSTGTSNTTNTSPGTWYMAMVRILHELWEKLVSYLPTLWKHLLVVMQAVVEFILIGLFYILKVVAYLLVSVCVGALVLTKTAWKSDEFAAITRWIKAKTKQLGSAVMKKATSFISRGIALSAELVSAATTKQSDTPEPLTLLWPSHYNYFLSYLFFLLFVLDCVCIYDSEVVSSFPVFVLSPLCHPM